MWAAGALFTQVRAARPRRDLSVAAGIPRHGQIYFFTVAMLPAHKESVRNHPLEFAIGTLMHAGLLAAFFGAFLAVIHAAAGSAFLRLIWPLFALSFVAAISLLLRRVFGRTLRRMSSPDDYLAITASAGFLAMVLLAGLNERALPAALCYSTLLLIYIPLGKLRHAAFFFAARADLGGRLGYRGALPPSTEAD